MDGEGEVDNALHNGVLEGAASGGVGGHGVGREPNGGALVEHIDIPQLIDWMSLINPNPYSGPHFSPLTSSLLLFSSSIFDRTQCISRSR